MSENIGLKRALEIIKISQRQLAKQLGVSQSYINHIANGATMGERSRPVQMTMEMAINISLMTDLKILPEELSPYLDFNSFYEFVRKFKKIHNLDQA